MFLFLFLIVVAVYVLSVYNRFATTRARIAASIQEIGNQLKRQADLIPNLVDSVKGYLKHEKGIFTDLTDARKAILEASKGGDAQSMVNASEKLQKTFGKFIALVESTPQLRGVEAVTKLMDEVRDTADKIMYSRRVLIDLSADYNIMMATFPSNFVAKLFNFQSEKGLIGPRSGDHLEVSEDDIKTPKVKLEE